MCCRCWGQTLEGLNIPTLQRLPELVSSSSLCCPLRSSSRAEVALIPQSSGSPVKPRLLHSPHRTQVVFGGFSFKHGCWWWDSCLCVGLSGCSLPSVLPTDPFQPLPSPNHGPAVPTLCQGSQRLSDSISVWVGKATLEGHGLCSPLVALWMFTSCAGLACHQRYGSRAERWRPGGAVQRSPAHSSLFPHWWGWCPTEGVPGAVCDITPQWHRLPGQLWPPAGAPQPITPSQVSPSSLRPDAPGRGSVHAQV